MQHDEIQEAITKLQGFREEHPGSANNSERQKEAAMKMGFLREDQLRKLILDVSREADLRRGVFRDQDLGVEEKDDLSRKKLQGLSHNKFANLVDDVLFVVDRQTVQRGQSDEPKDAFADMEDMVAALRKNATDEERVKRKLQQAISTRYQFELFTEYLRSTFSKKNIDTSVLDTMDAIIERHCEDGLDKCIDHLSSAKEFVEYADKFFGQGVNPEYEYHRKNLHYLIENHPQGCKKLAIQEMSHIFAGMLLKYDVIDTDNSRIITREDTTRLVDSLEGLVNALKVDSGSPEVRASGSRLLDASDEFYTKLQIVPSEEARELCRTYWSQQKSIENVLCSDSTEQELFASVMEFTCFLRETFIALNVDVS